jgi:hypothetical protein
MKGIVSNYKEKVDKKLIIRQRIFFILILILLSISTVNTVQGKVTILLAVSGFLLATAVGVLLSRMFKVFWHEEKGKVVSRLDTLGILLLIIYIAIEATRNWIFSHWLSGPTLTSFGLIILTGLLLGRFLGTLISVHKILNE